ncbi:Aste57867_16081 [Aphanomyces stellatus]|uniref:Aste57867_16081 protein n=1 Tax=Aphanomyces stellatus TaxID=120398 RepID=A0A485L5Z6_9STRA|nr:hypothetical protein As57867_016025 [Aphanomyces stellatus]VFT92864.1 Aste57867_16081 [Aphanomyces stellatus]
MAAPAFRCPPLSADEVEAFVRMAERTAQELATYSRLENGPIKWRLHATEPNLQVYEGFDARGPANERVWCAISELQATLEEVQMMNYTESSEDYKLFTQKFFTDILDAARLYNVVAPTDSKPLDFVGVNWVLQKSPGKGLIRNRDWCFVEGHMETEVYGRRAWIRAQKSINLACCPDLQADAGFVRGMHTRSGYLYIELAERPGYLTIVQYNQGFVKGEVKGKMADWFYASSMVARYRKIAELETVIRKYRLSKATFLPKHKLLATDTRTHCHVCDKPFGKTKKLNCRKCGDVVCRHCSKIYEVKVQGQWGELRVCEPCVFGKVDESQTLSLRPTASNSLPDDWIRKLQLSASDLSDAEVLMDTRDTLVHDIHLHASRFKPQYKPEMAEKFHVDGFFTPKGTETEAAVLSNQIVLLDENDPLYDEMRCYPTDEMRSTGCSSLDDDAAFFVLDRESTSVEFDDAEYLQQYLAHK